MSPYFQYFSQHFQHEVWWSLLWLTLHLFQSNHLIKLKQTLVTISELSYNHHNHHVPSSVTTNEGSPVKFVTIRERQRFESIATSWAEILTQSHTYLRQGSLRSPLVQLRYTCHGFNQHRITRDNQLPGWSGPAYPWAHIWLPAHPYYLQCAHSNRTRPNLS